MFNFFRRSPINANREFSDLSFMLFRERESPTYKRDLLDERKLDFSVESLKHLDEYLKVLHAAPPHQEDLIGVALRCGAYVGEVIRKNSHNKMDWVAFKEAAKYSEYVKGLGHSLGTAGILWTNPETMCFPLTKVCKFLENGNEDSVYFFARVILKDPQDPELARAIREWS